MMSRKIDAASSGAVPGVLRESKPLEVVHAQRCNPRRRRSPRGASVALALTGVGFVQLGDRIPDPLLPAKSASLQAASEAT
jgi:hypothetical protein